ncbi:hypothetical protein CEXT_311481 [Caerostris extrusa]|uniref:Uncharacterized protein n=1 Tax=Caerostris extrusa TaxID=172846 RepID=A0AAV4W6W3_CAEEX|nr:hypothetical protein CEXT_311481 [Caerostris extrusa]
MPVLMIYSASNDNFIPEKTKNGQARPPLTLHYPTLSLLQISGRSGRKHKGILCNIPGCNLKDDRKACN